MARVEQADLLLAQAERARREQARVAAVEERTRIAREIHDVLAHSLGAPAVQLDVTEALLDDVADNDLVHTCAQDGPAFIWPITSGGVPVNARNRSTASARRPNAASAASSAANSAVVPSV